MRSLLSTTQTVDLFGMLTLHHWAASRSSAAQRVASQPTGIFQQAKAKPLYSAALLTGPHILYLLQHRPVQPNSTSNGGFSN